MGGIDDAVEKKIRAAIERGEFDGLPGAGKPLDLSDADDPDWWVKRMIRREGLSMSGALPPVLSLRREREEFPESLADLATEAGVRAVLTDYNRRVKEDRLRSVPLGRGIPVVAPLVDVEAMVAAWAALRERTAAASRSATFTDEDPVSADPSPGRTQWWRHRWRRRRPA